VEGALVLLLDSLGNGTDGRLTDSEGRFHFNSSSPGLFRLRVIRIGYQNHTSPAIRLEEGQEHTIHLSVPMEAVELEGIRVEGLQQCRIRPQEGLAVARVWNEILKALTIQTWTERQGLFLFEVSVYERELKAKTLEVLSEERGETRIMARIPMNSPPPEELVEGGFIRPLERDAFEYLAPDARVLLSDAFLDTHCFNLVESESDPLIIGLGFRPRQIDDQVPDVEGTLWVDRETGALKSLDFHYTWVPFDLGIEQAGGRLDFQLIPNGAWIVRRWWIRMPTVTRVFPHTRLDGFKETGAEVVSLTPAEGG